MSDDLSRCASLCGSNAQANLQIVLPGPMDYLKVDQQDNGEIPGYRCLSEVQRWGIQSLDRTSETSVMNSIRI